jgi:hypothetical protein
MPLTAEQRDALANELKTFGASLKLSDDQKQKLHGFMAEASEKIQQYKQQNPNASPQDILKKVAENRSELRGKLVNFLTPEQLTTWDAEMAKAKQFLGQKVAAA